MYPVTMGKGHFPEWKVKSSLHIHVVSDIYRERGPLGGIHACMKAMDTPYCLVLPVDVPQFPVETLEELLLVHENSLGKAASENSEALGMEERWQFRETSSACSRRTDRAFDGDLSRLHG